MDETYQINVQKTELREAYNVGDVERLVSVFNPSGFTDMSEGGPSKYGFEALRRFYDDAAQLFASYFVRFTPIVIRITVMGNVAFDYGWHEFTLTPKVGGASIRKRERYFDLWSRDSKGAWKIMLHISNLDVPEELQGYLSTWFLSEKQAHAQR